MNTITKAHTRRVMHTQYITDTAGAKLVILSQGEFEAMLGKSAYGSKSTTQDRLTLARIMKEESKAVTTSSMEILREFEAIDDDLPTI